MNPTPSHTSPPALHPVTPLQRAFLLGRSDTVELGGVAGHVYHEIEGHWDVTQLEDALRAVVSSHPALRTAFTPGGCQVVQEKVPVHIRTRDLRALPVRARAEALAAYRERVSHRVAPPARPPLLHVEVSVLAEDQMILHVSHDGLVMDGTSMFLFFRAWWDAYHGTIPTEAGVSCADYVAHLESARDSAEAQRRRDWWRNRFERLAPAPELPLAVSPSSVKRPRFTRRQAGLTADRWAALKQHAQRHGTPEAALLAAYGQVLAYWGADERFTVGATTQYRPPFHPGITHAIGNFSQILPVDLEVDPLATFAQHCTTADERLRAVRDNLIVSADDMPTGTDSAAGGPRTPYTFTFAIGYGGPGVDGSALELFGREVFSAGQTPGSHLDVFAMERNGAVVVQIDTVDSLYQEGLPDAWAAGFQRLLDRLCDAPAWAETTCDLLPDEQRRQRAEANDTVAPQPTRMLWEDIVARATAAPGRPAVITSDGVVSYGELLSRAEHAAAWLRQRDVGRGDLVGLVMWRGPEQIVGILAALLAGAAYLPIDAGLPAERKAYLLTDGGARCVLTNVPGLDGDALLIDNAPLPNPSPPVRPPADAHVDDLAYVLYTSGTTGQPKGVMVSHRNVANVVTDCTARFGVDVTDRFFGISAFNFDLSVYDVFGALSVGAAIVLPDAERAVDPAHWLDLCSDHGVTVWNSVPAIVAMLLEEAAAEPNRLDALRLVMISGDRIPMELPAALLRRLPDLEIVSLGGPTETTIWNILHPVSAADDGSRPIPYGRPNSNNTAFVRGPAGWDRPDWVAGEIWAGGTGVARGYHGDPIRTAERFSNGLYRTGDLGRYLPDGSIEILGRSDFQIKINGYRIEAGEVETRLQAMPTVKQAVVVRHTGPQGNRLVAHMILAGESRPGLAQLRDHLATFLPEYMIPSAVIWHDALPLTGNGKVDRGRLGKIEPAPEAAAALESAPIRVASVQAALADSGSLETELAELWSGVLKVPYVPRDASIYDFGGNSLTAIRILSEVRRRFGVTIPLSELHDVNTVRAMASHMQAAR